MALALLGALAGAAPAHAAPTGGHNDPQSVVYVEVNSNDLANVADYTLEDTGAPVFDMAMIFAANINYDGKAAYLHLNERVTWTLENAATQIRPVQAKGTKVLLSVLGNHEGAGFSNFGSAEEADAFAAQVAETVKKYRLDGVDLDDEWSEYGKNGTLRPNIFSIHWLLQALRTHLGNDKLITFYNIGPSKNPTSLEGVTAASLLDYAWNPNYGEWEPPSIPGMGPDRLGAAAINLGGTPANTIAELAKSTLDKGYGVFVTYDLRNGDRSADVSEFTEPLYGQRALYRG
jgi:hypothetical protein